MRVDEDRVRRITEEFFNEARKSRPPEDAPAIVAPVDIYQRNQDMFREDSRKSFPRGSSAIVNSAVVSVIEGDGAEGLAHAHRRAKGDSDYLKSKGDRTRADLVKQQYMEEKLIPAIEVVVNYTSPDEVLNSKQALSELDKYVLLEGSGKGYTASYIRQAYGDQLGQVEGRSDAYVKSEMQNLNRMLDEGNVRTAYGLANKLKGQIDKGERIASEEDFELIEKVLAYYG